MQWLTSLAQRNLIPLRRRPFFGGGTEEDLFNKLHDDAELKNLIA